MQIQTRDTPPITPSVPADTEASPPPPWLWRIYAGLTAYLGLPIIAAWIAIAIAAVMLLPDFGAASGFGLVELVPGNTPALQAQALENRLFGSSLSDAQAVVVEHDPAGLPPSSVASIAQEARSADTSRPESAPASRPEFALPIVNVAGVVPSSRGTDTTVLTYLFFSESAQSGDITLGAQRYEAAMPHPAGASIGVTGPLPAQISEGNTIENSLLLLEIVTVIVIAVLVGAVFRSPIAPVVPLAGAGVAYLVTARVLGWGARMFHIQIPPQLAPIIIVLILGVVTDYSVFTLTGMRARLGTGERRTSALRATVSRVVPLVIAAALTVAAGTVALIGADLDFFHAVGPGMAVAVVIAGLVSISFVPAVVGVLGRVAFWPRLQRVTRSESPQPSPRVSGGRQLIARLLSRRSANRGRGGRVLVLVAAGSERAAGSPPRHQRAQRVARRQRAASGRGGRGGRIQSRDRRADDVAAPGSRDWIPACPPHPHRNPDEGKPRCRRRCRTRPADPQPRDRGIPDAGRQRGPHDRGLPGRPIRRLGHCRVHHPAGSRRRGHACGGARGRDGRMVGSHRNLG